MSILIVHCSCPDRETADRIASDLVEKRLAACVSILPSVRSVYRWKGEIQRDEEALLIAKTRRERLEALESRIVELHPYELPEILAVEAAGGSEGYLAWIREETAASEG